MWELKPIFDMTANGLEGTIGHHSESALLLISHAKGRFLEAAATQNVPFNSKT